MHQAGSNPTQETLDRLGVPREVLAKMAEVEQQPPESKIREEEDLKKDLKALGERIRPMPGPDIPLFVGDDMGDRTEWPLLDAATASELEKYCDNDLFTKEMVFTLGEYLSSSLSTGEIKLWIPSSRRTP
jgi:tRNA U34 5-methylaminomethyl-2-thiouridine-forming methyltransferase MnmC